MKIDDGQMSKHSEKKTRKDFQQAGPQPCLLFARNKFLQH